MHTPAPPKNMQSMVNSYDNVVKDIKKIFKKTIIKLQNLRYHHLKLV